MACDGSNLNPVALALLNFKFGNGQYAIPSPQVNLPVTNSTQLPVGQSTFAIPASYKETQFSVNIDQVITQKNSLSGRFFYSRAPTREPFSPNAASVPGWGTNELDQNTMFVLADTHVFNSNLINVARFGFIRFDGLSAVLNPIQASDLGISTPTGAPGVARGERGAGDRRSARSGQRAEAWRAAGIAQPQRCHPRKAAIKLCGCLIRSPFRVAQAGTKRRASEHDVTSGQW